MTYAISDPHNDVRRFKGLLRATNFSQQADTLYIIGDVIDPGLDLLLKIMDMGSSLVLLRGNHEDLMLRSIKHPEGRWYRIWSANRNKQTVTDYLSLSPSIRYEVIEFLESCSVSLDLEVENRKFHLIHGWPNLDNDDFAKVWTRPTFESVNPLTKTLLVGHTHVPLILYPNDPFARNNYLKHLHKTRDHIRIFHGQGDWHGLDCGCAYRGISAGRLACLRLEDMHEFYIR